MGIGNQFVPLLKNKVGFQTLKGNPLLLHKHIAVDLSTILHLCLHRDGVSHEFHMSPPIPLKSFALEFRKCTRLLVSVPRFGSYAHPIGLRRKSPSSQEAN